MFALNGDGPLAQLAEQGTFNPKVAGSIPSRPTTFPASLRRFAPHGKGLRLDGPTCGHAAGQWAIVQRQDSGFWFQLSRFESWWLNAREANLLPFFLFANLPASSALRKTGPRLRPLRAPDRSPPGPARLSQIPHRLCTQNESFRVPDCFPVRLRNAALRPTARNRTFGSAESFAASEAGTSDRGSRREQ